MDSSAGEQVKSVNRTNEGLKKSKANEKKSFANVTKRKGKTYKLNYKSWESM